MLVHPASERARKFARLIPLLEDFDVVSFDRRGFGESVPGVSRTIDDCVNDIGTVVDYATAIFGRKPVLVAQCWGAALSLAFAERYQSALAGAGFWEPLSIRQFWSGENLATALAGGMMSGRDMVLARFGGEPGFAQIPKNKQAEFLRHVEGIEAEGRLIIGDRPFKDPSNLTIPCVVGLGRATDFIGAAEASTWLSEEIPGAMLIEFPGGGHPLHWMQPARYAQFVRLAVANAENDTSLATFTDIC